MNKIFILYVLLIASLHSNGQSAESFLKLGNTKEEKGEYTGAISNYDTAIKMNPKFAIAYINRGYSKNNLKDYTGALADYNKAIELNPKLSGAYNNRGATKNILKVTPQNNI
jgi:tetratricopeptide (TPR) repeat protein